MRDPRLDKRWKAAELMLANAAELLLTPSAASIPSRTIEEYDRHDGIDDLQAALERLEGIAYRTGAKSGFWRRLKKAASQMDLVIKASSYELEFHRALARQENYHK